MATDATIYDYTGENPDYFIVREQHVLSEVNSDSKRTLILDNAPCYRNNFILEHRDPNGNYTPLLEGVDFNFGLLYMGATYTVGKEVFGGVVIHREFVNGTIAASYQCLARKPVNRALILENLASSVYNPRVGVWENVAGAMEHFPAAPHLEDLQNLKGMEDLIQAFNKMTDALTNQPKASLQYQQETLAILTNQEEILQRLSQMEVDIKYLQNRLNQGN